MTKQAYDYFLRFSTYYFQKVFANCKSYRKLEPVDFLHSSLAEINNYSDLKKTIARQIYSEYYSYLGELQSVGLPINQSKYCKNCQKVKDYSEFYIVLDKRYNFRFCKSKCKDCVKKKTSSPEFKEQRRNYYANSTDLKEKAILRTKQYYVANTDRVKDRIIEWQKSNKERIKLANLKRIEKAKSWWELLSFNLKNKFLADFGFKKANQKAILKIHIGTKKEILKQRKGVTYHTRSR
jgi:hypothetical protein